MTAAVLAWVSTHAYVSDYIGLAFLAGAVVGLAVDRWSGSR